MIFRKQRMSTNALKGNLVHNRNCPAGWALCQQHIDTVGGEGMEKVLDLAPNQRFEQNLSLFLVLCSRSNLFNFCPSQFIYLQNTANNSAQIIGQLQRLALILLKYSIYWLPHVGSLKEQFDLILMIISTQHEYCKSEYAVLVHKHMLARK